MCEVMQGCKPCLGCHIDTALSASKAAGRWQTLLWAALRNMSIRVHELVPYSWRSRLRAVQQYEAANASYRHTPFGVSLLACS